MPSQDAATPANLKERSDALHARARAFVSAFERGEPTTESFDSLACDLARFQHDAIPGYARLCKRRGVDIASITHASDAPAVPTDAFKLTRVFAFGDEEASVTFRTSGTTIGQRGTHRMRNAVTYDAAAIAFGKHALAPNAVKIPVLVIGPSTEESPDSSLVHMMDAFRVAFGDSATASETYFIADGVIDLAALDERVSKLIVGNRGPALVLGTSFSFVHFLDAIGDGVFPLPRDSRVMQTGGFKGKSREVDAQTLTQEIARVFCIDPQNVISEYGMTELSSQFYTSTASLTLGAKSACFTEPPWARVIPVDPELLTPVKDGEVGIARIVDLMNVDSAAFVLAADRVRRIFVNGIDVGFELLGRLPGATPRGCSIAIDEILGGN